MGRGGAEEGVKVEDNRREGIENAKLELATVLVLWCCRRREVKARVCESLEEMLFACPRMLPLAEVAAGLVLGRVVWAGGCAWAVQLALVAFGEVTR